MAGAAEEVAQETEDTFDEWDRDDQGGRVMGGEGVHRVGAIVAVATTARN